MSGRAIYEPKRLETAGAQDAIRQAKGLTHAFQAMRLRAIEA